MEKYIDNNLVFQEVQQALQIVGDKWSALILLCLFDQPRRFGEIEQQSGMSPRTLTKKLALLEKAGLIEKENFNEFPPRTEYRVTAKARDLKEVIQGLKYWAKKYCACAQEISKK